MWNASEDKEKRKAENIEMEILTAKDNNEDANDNWRMYPKINRKCIKLRK